MRSTWLCVGTLLCLIAGCGGDPSGSPQQTAVLPRPLAPTTPAPAAQDLRETFAYHGDRYRDPFIPLTGEGVPVTASEEVVTPNIGTLALKGIFNDGKIKMALISGGNISYVLKGSMLYDNRQRLVKGVSGVIKNDSVILIAPDKTTKELRLREKP